MDKCSRAKEVNIVGVRHMQGVPAHLEVVKSDERTPQYCVLNAVHITEKEGRRNE